MNAPMLMPSTPLDMPSTPMEPPKPITHDVTILTTRKRSQARVLGVPPEEFGIEKGARDIPTCNYAFHDIVTKTRGQLIAEGFDAEQISALTEFTGLTTIETLERDTVWEHMSVGGDSGINPSSQLVQITEHYVRMDFEGNGKPALYQVITGGDQGDVLTKDGKDCITPFDAIPFAATTPVPMTHRFFGRSIADLVMHTQREKTALKRGALDNLYLHNNPRVEIAEQNAGPNTLDDLLVSRPGNVVRTKTPGGLNWQVVPDITGAIWPALQYLDAELESRTGLSKQTQGIDANAALQNQSATAVAQVFTASQMRMKLIARIMAEGVKDIFALLHATIRKHGQQAETVRLTGRWVSVDPRDWKARNHMTINVGLGSGGKAQQFAQIMALGNVQKELLAGGKANLVDDKALYNTASELTRIMGHKNPDKFFNDPSAKDPQTGQLLHPPVPPPPDPKLQIEQMKLTAQQQELQQKGQLDAAKAQADMGAIQFKAQADVEHQRAKLVSDAALAEKKAALEEKQILLEAELKAREDARSHELHQQKMAHSQQLHEHEMERKRAEMGLAVQAHQHKLEQGHAATESKIKASEAKVKAPAPKPEKPKPEPKQNPADDAIRIIEAVAKVKKPPTKVIRDDKGQITGFE